MSKKLFIFLPTQKSLKNGKGIKFALWDCKTPRQGPFHCFAPDISKYSVLQSLRSCNSHKQSCWLPSFRTPAAHAHSVLTFGFLRVNDIKYAQYQNSIRWETLSLPRVTYSGCGLSEMLPELQLLCMHRKAWKWMMYSFLYYWTKHYIFSNNQTFKCSKKQCTRYIQTHRALVLLRHILLVFH